MKLRVCVALLVLPFAATAGTITSHGPFYSSYKLSPANGGGCVSGTIGDAVPGNRRAEVYFIAEADVASPRKSASFAYVDDAGEDDFLPGIAAFTLCLKPGNYRIYGIATESVFSRERFSIPFQVVSGKNFYLGNFMFYGYAHDPDCEDDSTNVFVGFRDEFARDLPHLAGGPDGASLPVEKRLIDPAGGAPYFARCLSLEPAGASGPTQGREAD